MYGRKREGGIKGGRRAREGGIKGREEGGGGGKVGEGAYRVSKSCGCTYVTFLFSAV